MKDKNNEGDANFEKSASYNQAVFQMQRLNKLLDENNICSANLLGVDPDTGKLGYATVFENLCSIFAEISTKVEVENQDDVIKIKNLIGDYINEYKNKIFYSTGSKKIKIRFEVWDPLEKALFRFKLDVMNIMEKHGFATPLKQDPRQAMHKQN